MSDIEEDNQRNVQQLISTLPFSEGWSAAPLRYFHNFWYPQHLLPGAIAFCDCFNPRDTDIMIASPPKSGTTWLKALVFATVNRKQHSPFSIDHPLRGLHPHDCVPLIDTIYLRGMAPKFDSSVAPRLLNSHMPYSILPESVKASNCRIIYICRNLKDTFVSTWYFCKETIVTGRKREPISIEEAFEMYCDGKSPLGPVWDHQLEYWRESLRRPDKLLFLKYEDVMDDTVVSLKKLAEFIGHPFLEEEERDGMVEGIVKLCSFESLTKVEANKKGERGLSTIMKKNSSYFCKGKIGDWENHLSPEMARRLDEIVEEKLSPYGLSFNLK